MLSCCCVLLLIAAILDWPAHRFCAPSTLMMWLIGLWSRI